MLEEDLAAEREERRERKGFVSPSAATTFLSQSRLTSLQEIIESKSDDHITRAYFKSMENLFSNNAKTSAEHDEPFRPSKKLSEIYNELREVEGLSPLDPMQSIGHEEKEETASFIKQAIRKLKAENWKRYDGCLMELNYLANVLISGHPIKNRKFRPVEAAEKVMEICDIGASYMIDTGEPDGNRIDQVTRILESESFVKIFKIGWHINNDVETK